jgi:hypothetical protein
MIHAVADDGTIVMPGAMDPALLDLVTGSGRTVVTVAAAGATATQRKTGWRIAVRDGDVVHEDGEVTTAVASLADLLQTAAAGRPANDVDPAAVLAAIAAGISLGLPRTALRRGLPG